MSRADFITPHYVEIAGIKWATKNVGATSVTDIGLYFQWGDTIGYTASQVGSGNGKKYFGWADYKYSNGTSSPSASDMTKYNSTDGKTTLDLSDDAARANIGESWRMPTDSELTTLINSTNHTWVTNYLGSGVNGRLFTSKTDSNASIFFPASGYCVDGSVYDVGSYGFYWGSSLDSGYPLDGRSLYFSYGYSDVGYDNLQYGFPVRGVVG